MICPHCNLPAPKGRKSHQHCTSAAKQRERKQQIKPLGEFIGNHVYRSVFQPIENNS